MAAERAFSMMNTLKCKSRNRLNSRNLNLLMSNLDMKHEEVTEELQHDIAKRWWSEKGRRERDIKSIASAAGESDCSEC